MKGNPCKTVLQVILLQEARESSQIRRTRLRADIVAAREIDVFIREVKVRAGGKRT